MPRTPADTQAWISEHDPLGIVPLDDPLVESLGFEPRSVYAETYWLPVLGPSALWALRRLSRGQTSRPTEPPSPCPTSLTNSVSAAARAATRRSCERWPGSSCSRWLASTRAVKRSPCAGCSRRSLSDTSVGCPLTWPSVTRSTCRRVNRRPPPVASSRSTSWPCTDDQPGPTRSEGPAGSGKPGRSPGDHR